MTHDARPPRQPLFWGALAFSVGLWVGARAWRPPSWWLIAILTFLFSASWILAKRPWPAKTLSLSLWVLLGALFIQIRSQSPDDAQLNPIPTAALADGSQVTLTAHVLREGYARAAGQRSTRSIDVETEQIANADGSWPIKTGIRLTVYE